MSKTRARKQVNQNQQTRSNKSVFASASIDLGGGFAFGDPRKDTYVKPVDLFVEPTAKRLEHSSEQYVPFLTDRNNLLDYIYSLTNTSPTLSSIINQKTTITSGVGFTLENKKSILIDTKGVEITDQLKEEVSNFLEDINPEGETIFDILLKVCNDFYSFGNAFIELIRTELKGMKGFYVRHIPVHMCRPKKVEGKSRHIRYIGVSDRWIEKENFPIDVVDYPLYDFQELDEDKHGVVNEDKHGIVHKKRKIIHIKNYRPQFFYWGVPDYLASTMWGEMEYRTAKFNQAKFDNGFKPSAIILAKGNFSDEEAHKLVDKFQRKFTGTGNNSKVLFQVSNDPESDLKVITLEEKIDGKFLELQKIARQQIVTGTRWTQSLAGIGISGQLGSNQQIVAEFAIIKNMVIDPVKKMLENKLLAPILKEAGEWKYGTEDWGKVSLKIDIKTPVSFLGDIKVNETLTQDEQREILGYDSLGDNI